MSPRTLAELLAARAARPRTDGPALRFLDGGGSVQVDLSGEALLARAQRGAARLVDAGVQPGDRVLLMLTSQAEVVDAFFSAVWAGAVPVPLYPPVFAHKLEDFVARFVGIADNARARLLLVSDELLIPAQTVLSSLQSTSGRTLTVLGPDAWAPRGSDAPLSTAPARTGDDLAFLQYTSGSTGAPKGVALSHDNVLHNVGAICRATSFGSHDVGVSWLPLYHDMGLVGGLLSTLYADARLVFLSPLTFARRPLTWLRALSNERGTLSPAPNFAFRRCLTLADADLEGLDLSSWRIAFNGAEAVDAGTLDAFAKRMAPFGFRRSAFLPVYGLAEHTLAVTFSAPGTEPRIEHVDRAALATTHEARVVPATHPDALPFVGVGAPLGDVTVRIVQTAPKTAGLPCAEGVVGAIEVKSPSVMQGYFRNEAATAEALTDGWLRTGDLGYRRDGCLFITGRQKDLIIIAGRNFYPEDLEAAAAGVAGVRAGRVVAFAVPTDDGEAAALVAERGVDTPDGAGLEVSIKRAVAERVGLTPARVLLLEPGALPLTSSGKVQRALTRARFLNGTLEPDEQR